MTHATIVDVLTQGDACTLPGGIALRARGGDGSYMVQDFSFPDRDLTAARSYFNGAYELTLAEAVEEFNRRVQRATRFNAGGSLVEDSASIASGDVDGAARVKRLEELLGLAESFLAGFEGDETQTGVDELLEAVRIEIDNDRSTAVCEHVLEEARKALEAA